MSKIRLESQLKRLKLKPDLFNHQSVIKDQLNAGVLEKVVDKEDPLKQGSVHYIPHREVLRQDRQTTKLRIVYDASAKAKDEVSLNDCLHPGPNLVPLIFDVLLRFRLHKIITLYKGPSAKNLQFNDIIK